MSDQPGRYIGEQPPQQGFPVEQDPQQNPQQGSPTPNMFNQLVQEERVKNFISQTSPTETLERINYVLKGYIYDLTRKEWVKISDGIPEKIRLDFLQFITTDLSEDVRMTNLNDKQINGIMETTIEWVIDYLDDVADDKDINLEESQMSKIALIMIKAVFYTVLRAHSGIESRRMYNSLNLTGGLDSFPGQNPQQNKKWYEFWK
ncbi:MAG TPA: hypothetical protein ENH99_00135 [Candidatus Pacearchaeota archaeon]|nr:hypothetical protein [Candidatus Pacearchaeota archaeon]